MAWELRPLASPGDAVFSHLEMCDSSRQLKEPRYQREAWAPDTCGERGMSTSGVGVQGTRSGLSRVRRSGGPGGAAHVRY